MKPPLPSARLAFVLLVSMLIAPAGFALPIDCAAYPELCDSLNASEQFQFVAPGGSGYHVCLEPGGNVVVIGWSNPESDPCFDWGMGLRLYRCDNDSLVASGAQNLMYASDEGGEFLLRYVDLSEYCDDQSFNTMGAVHGCCVLTSVPEARGTAWGTVKGLFR